MDVQKNSAARSHPVFEFPFALNGENVTMAVTSVRGHVMSQDFAEGYGWNSVAAVTLFEAPIVTFVPEVSPLPKQRFPL